MGKAGDSQGKWCQTSNTTGTCVRAPSDVHLRCPVANATCHFWKEECAHQSCEPPPPPPPPTTTTQPAPAPALAGPPVAVVASSRRLGTARLAFDALAGDLRALALGQNNNAAGGPGGHSQRAARGGSFRNFGADDGLVTLGGVSGAATAQEDLCLAGQKLCGGQGQAATAFAFFQWALSLAAAVLCTWRRPALAGYQEEGQPRPLHGAVGILAALAAFAGLLAVSLEGNISQLLHSGLGGSPLDSMPAKARAELEAACSGTLPGADAPHPGYSFVLCILAWLMHLLACAACLHMRRSGGALAAAGYSGKPQLMNGDHQDAYMALGDDDDGKGPAFSLLKRL